MTIPVINPTLDCDSVFKEYECPVCFTVMKPPIHIYQCTSGHNICSNCKSKGIKGCPTCRKPISGRAHNMENIAKLIFLDESESLEMVNDHSCAVQHIGEDKNLEFEIKGQEIGSDVEEKNVDCDPRRKRLSTQV